MTTFEKWGEELKQERHIPAAEMYADWKASREKLLAIMKMLEGATETFLAAIRRTIQEVKGGAG